MANILHIETSTEVCSVAISINDKVSGYVESTEGFHHSEKLMVFIDELFSANGISPSEIDAVCVSKGPGSYTGLRIGVSTAKGICYALGIPLLSVSTLDALAYHMSQNYHEYGIGISPDTLLCPMIDARRMEVYTALYNSTGLALTEITAQVIEMNSFMNERQNHRILFFGNGAEKCKTILSDGQSVFIDGVNASARFMPTLAYKHFTEKKFEDIAYFGPFYLKDFVATVPKNKVL